MSPARARKRRAASILGLALAAGVVWSCSSAGGGSTFDNSNAGGSGTGATGGKGGAAASATGPGQGGSLGQGAGGTGIGAHDGGPNLGDGSAGTAGFTGDPKTCDQAAQAKSYIGCDYWPTVVANNVWSIFDYTVVVANAADQDADITVTGPNGFSGTTSVGAGQLIKLYLPWVPTLKGPDTDTCGTSKPLMQTVGQVGGAYHLVTSIPVTVYQFNALEYKGAGGPAGKDWSSCPGNQVCLATKQPLGCFSFSNDASLLLPSTAMTGNYRLTSHQGWQLGMIGAYAAITGTADGTQVAVKLGPNAHILPGAGISADPGPGGVFMFNVNAGDVLELVGTPNSDLGGTQIQANAPVQVIAGMPCVYIPDQALACDHIEESVFPAETLGKHYFVTVPTSPHGKVVGAQVRIFGNVDGTMLTYGGSPPPGAPSTIDAGQVVDLGIVTKDFEITGDHEFAVSIFQEGGSVVDPEDPMLMQRGDPAQSGATAVEQYRSKYIFLAPDDYDESWVDIIMPMSANVTLDGMPITAQPTAISSGYGIARQALGPGQGGAHVLTADMGVGIQVMGYGSYTSYQYPGGLNLLSIAPPPMPILH